MEFIHGRPPLGNIYCPTRITLNDYNEYLNTVGLIVLIRGSPSPQLPGLIAQKLVEVHGGHIEEYEVSEATITPYLLTCSSTQARNNVVQRGLYTIPQHRLQFRVHEWRPRFGMGHNPPTHQVWVKIIGLPLQAWTAPEIARVLQRFGHPIQILPFGRDAGHYRDITALVETSDPSLILLSYVYREGDYSTQIDILILAWRHWEDSHFPPPPNPPFNDASPAPSNQQDSQPTPRRLSSSSSTSNRAPSQPTIDYSSWSPRSHQTKELIALRSDPRSEADTQHLSNNHCHTPLRRATFDSRRTSILIGMYSQNQETATADQSSFPKAHGIYPLKLFSLNFISRPIVINPLRYPSTIRSANLLLSLGDAQKDLYTDPKSTTPSPLRINVLSANIMELSHLDLTTPLGQQNRSKRKSIDFSAQPNFNTNATLSLSKQARHYSISLAQPNLHTTMGLHLFTQAQDNTPSFDQAHFSPLVSGLNPTLPQQATVEEFNLNEALPEPLQPNNAANQTLPQPATPSYAHINNSPPQPQPIANPLDSRQKRKQAMPTRRSQRILEKRNTADSEQTAKKRNKTTANMIQFDKISHHSPLDASITLQILQATGVTINKQIEDLVEEAVKQDQATGNIDQPTPTTPLHDPIPPLAIPGTDMLL